MDSLTEEREREKERERERERELGAELREASSQGIDWHFQAQVSLYGWGSHSSSRNFCVLSAFSPATDLEGKVGMC
jgi:hypothetical protein